MIEIQRALFDAHYKTLRIKRESSYWEAHHADNYMIFSWDHQIWPREPQPWYADRTIFPSTVTENWILKALKEKKHFFVSLTQLPRGWRKKYLQTFDSMSIFHRIQ